MCRAAWPAPELTQSKGHPTTTLGRNFCEQFACVRCCWELYVAADGCRMWLRSTCGNVKNADDFAAVLSSCTLPILTSHRIVRRHLDSAFLGSNKKPLERFFLFSKLSKKKVRGEIKQFMIGCMHATATVLSRDLQGQNVMLVNKNCYHKIVRLEPESSPAKISCF